MRRILFWDFDGTLAHRDGQWSGTLYSVARKHDEHIAISIDSIKKQMRQGFPWHCPEALHEDIQTSDEWWDRLSPTFIATFCELGFDSELAAGMARQVRREYLDHNRWSVADGAWEVLRELSTDGWQQVIISNHVPELPELCCQLGLKKYFEHIFTSASMGAEKPNAVFLRKVLDGVGAFEQAWVIGDSVKSDVASGSALRLKTILVGGEAPEATHCVSSLWQIPKLLKGEPQKQISHPDPRNPRLGSG